MLPYWYDAVVPDLAAAATVLVVAHGNSLRALVKHLDRISDAAIAELNIPTGIPLVYELTTGSGPRRPADGTWTRKPPPKPPRPSRTRAADVRRGQAAWIPSIMPPGHGWSGHWLSEK